MSNFLRRAFQIFKKNKNVRVAWIHDSFKSDYN